MIVVSGCTGGGDSGGDAASASPEAATRSTRETIPQPSLDALSGVTRRRLAPDRERVDLIRPSFSDPIRVTNPLFPIGELDAVILGEVEGESLRIETTLLPETKTVIGMSANSAKPGGRRSDTPKSPVPEPRPGFASHRPWVPRGSRGPDSVQVASAEAACP